ncbi:MAG: hypothetical protein WBA51_02965 [Erythrobacter sp.]
MSDHDDMHQNSIYDSYEWPTRNFEPIDDPYMPGSVEGETLRRYPSASNVGPYNDIRETRTVGSGVELQLSDLVFMIVFGGLGAFIVSAMF